MLYAIWNTVRNVKQIRRIQNSDKTPGKKILVTFHEPETKQEACQLAYKLRKAGHRFANIYLNEEIQRVIDKELRDERTRRNNELPEVTYNQLPDSQNERRKFKVLLGNMQ